MKFKERKLGDIMSIVSEKIDTKDIDQCDYISTENMIPDLGGVGIVSQMPNTKKVNAYKRTDTLFSNIRTYFRKVLFAEKDGGLSADVLVFRTKDSSELSPQYLYYLIANEDFTRYSVRTSRGVKMPRGDKDALLQYPVNLPSIQVQKLICDTLSVLDNKIANNKAMNQTLEKLTQRIFKSWFIDFDPVKANKEGLPFDGLSPEIQALFPSEFEDSELGMIPKGWEAAPLGDEFKVVMGQSPKGSSYNEDSEGAVFFQGRRDFNFRFPSARVYTTEPKKMADKNDTLLSVRAPVGDCNIALEDCCVGRGLAALRHNSGCSSLTYYTVQNLSRIFDKYDSEGTVFGSINQKDLKALKVIKSNNAIETAFSKVISPLDEKIKENTLNTQSLERIRDRLLPKLISGQISVGEATQELAEAV